jgi:predicted MFS family arabinose efflux permease
MSTTTSTVPGIDSLESESKTKEVILLVVLAAIQFSFLMDYILLMPLGPQLISELKIDPKLFSYLISSYTFSASIVGFICSFYIDRFDRKKALLFVYIGFSIGPFLCAVSSNFYLLLLARIFTGAFGGMLTSLVMTILGDAIPVKRLGRATSYVIAANGIASIVGVPVGLYLAHQWGWQVPFYALGVLAIILLITINIYIPSMRKHLVNVNVSQNRRTLAILKNPDFLWPIVFMSLLTFAGGFTILPFLSTYLVHNVSFTGTDISFLFFLGGTASFVTGPIAGNLIDKFGKQNIFLLMNFISIIPILLVTIFPMDSKLFYLVATTMFFMFSTARHVSGMALVNSRFTKEQRGRFLSINSSIQLMAGTAGTILSGYILYTDEDNLLMNFDILGIIAICATILCIFTAFVLEE